MRYCPFCAQENFDDVRECVHCGKRLPVAIFKPTPVEIEPTVQIQAMDEPPPPLVETPGPPTGTRLGIPGKSLSLKRTGPKTPIPQVVDAPVPPFLKLPPMPTPPALQSAWASVKYLPPLLRAWWARVWAQRTLSALVFADQRALDGVLKELGRAAREAGVDAPQVAEEMKRVQAEEARRLKAEGDAQAALDGVVREQERWRADEGDRRAQIAQKESEIVSAEALLKERENQRKVHVLSHGQLESQLRAAERRAVQADAKAQKLDVLPEDKGGGLKPAAAARLESEAAQKEAVSIQPLRDQAQERITALDGPIAEAEDKLAFLSKELELIKHDLADALAAHTRSIKQLEKDKQLADEEREGAEREMSQRFITVGTILNLNRIEGERFVPLYARIDELRQTLASRDAVMQRLKAERQSYDRPSLQKGLMTIGIAVFALSFFGIIAAILHSR